MADKLLAALRSAAKGLLFPSETDAPFEPFVWEVAANSTASVRRHWVTETRQCVHLQVRASRTAMSR